MPCPIPQVILCVIERNVLCRDLLLIQPFAKPRNERRLVADRSRGVPQYSRPLLKDTNERC
jgi:hypothetical protein